MPKNLAVEMRPKSIDDIIGQQHLVGKDGVIRRMVEAKTLSSMILYGPPGIGKTSIASAIAGTLGLDFAVMNASVDGKKELQAIVKQAEASDSGQMVVLLDEIHRLDKIKQDFLLSYMENSVLIVIGATTENPYINVTPAIRSRVSIFELKPVTPQDLQPLVDKALAFLKSEDKINVTLDNDARALLVDSSNGDVRSVLQTLEVAAKSSPKNHVRLSDIEAISQRKQMTADKDGDGHYNVISALQKSIRGSDTDAALHYAARIIESGDLQILVRRLTVIAYEDIGTADPVTVQQAITAINTAMSLGFPEARIPIANAIILLANAPKSNAAYVALDKAIADVQAGNFTDIPNALKDSHYKGAKDLGHGVTYKYAHDYPYDWVAQQYLPDNLFTTNPTYFVSKHNSKAEINLEQTYLTLKKQQYDQLKGNSNA